MHLKEEDILEGIKNQDHAVLSLVYKDYYPLIRNFVSENTGSDDDAKDIFQESLIVIYRKLKKSEIELSCKFSTFILTIARNLWFRQLRDNKKAAVESFDEEKDVVDLDSDISLEIDLNEQYKIYQKHFELLSKLCQEVLRLFYLKIPLKEIAEKMGYQSVEFVKSKKYKCKEKLVKRIKSDPLYLMHKKSKSYGKRNKIY